VEILISDGGSCFDSSSSEMEEEIDGESGVRPRNTASTADTGVYIPPEEPKEGHLSHFNNYSGQVKMIEEEEPRETLECPVDFEKELGEEMRWKELTEEQKIEVKDFLGGYDFRGKTRGFLRKAFDLVLSTDFCSYGISYGMPMKQYAGRYFWNNGISEEYG